jgi:hypothetical protein
MSMISFVKPVGPAHQSSVFYFIFDLILFFEFEIGFDFIFFPHVPDAAMALRVSASASLRIVPSTLHSPASAYFLMSTRHSLKFASKSKLQSDWAYKPFLLASSASGLHAASTGRVTDGMYLLTQEQIKVGVG